MAVIERTGSTMWALAKRLWDVPRSLTGAGNRETLRILAESVPLSLREVPTGERIWSWTVPEEWSLYGTAEIVGVNSGWRISNADNPLHVLGYSEGVLADLTFDELAPHLYTVPDAPTAIPYLTSYYERRWGFCLSQEQLDSMPRDDTYRVRIEATHFAGSLTWAEAVFPGHPSTSVLDDAGEVLFSTYICHPNLANDNLSGIVVAAALAEYVQSLPQRRYTYRFVFAPETIGALAFLHHNKQAALRRPAPVAGYVLTTLGGPGPHVLKPSRRGNTLADRVARHVMGPGLQTREVPFVGTGADERQFCSPTVDWPVAVIGKSMFHQYPEYHTSLDDLTFVTPAALEQSLDLYLGIVDTLEANERFVAVDPGVPKLDEKGLYPTLGAARDQAERVRQVMELLMFSDGEHDLIDIGNRLGELAPDLRPLADRMVDAGVLRTYRYEPSIIGLLDLNPSP